MKKATSALLVIFISLSLNLMLFSCSATMTKEATENNQADSNTNTYLITYSATLTENNSVGDSWGYGVLLDSEEIFSGDTVKVGFVNSFTLTLYAIEYDDASDDYGSANVRFSGLDVGDEETKIKVVNVKEDKGRYKGNGAKLEFIITCKRI